MSDHRNDLSDERAPDNVPRVRREHLRNYWKTWIRSIKRDPQKWDESGAIAIVVKSDGARLAFYPDPSSADLYLVRELDRGTGSGAGG